MGLPFHSLCRYPPAPFAPQLHATINKGLIPRSFPGVLLDMLLGLLGPLISWVYAGAVFDRVARKHAATRFAKLRRQ